MEQPTEPEEAGKKKETTKYFCDVWYCRARTTNHCKRCKQAFYCCKQHLNQSWHWHKPLCVKPGEQATVMDGRLLLHTLYKVLEDVSGALDGYQHGAVRWLQSAHCDARVIVVPTVGDVVARATQHSFCDAVGADQLQTARRAYWALRCAADAHAINLALQRLLQLCARSGYRVVQWSYGTTSSLLTEPRAQLLALEPRIVLERELAGVLHAAPPNKPVLHLVVATAEGWIVDAAAGRFWQFDGEERPAVWGESRAYPVLVGRVVDEFAEQERHALALGRVTQVVEERVEAMVFRVACELGLDPGLLEVAEEAVTGVQDVTEKEARHEQRRATLVEQLARYEERERVADQMRQKLDALALDGDDGLLCDDDTATKPEMAYDDGVLSDDDQVAS